ncbi:unnamed protein product [Brassica oleracea var. botrytis]
MDIEVSEGFIKYVETFYHGEFEKQDLVVNHEIRLYKNKSGPFGRMLALKGCEKKDEKFDPGNWWATYGCDSSFEGIHTKKRNIFNVNRLNSLVYVQFNAWLFDKQKKIRESNVDVILDDGNEDTVGDWLMGRVEELDNDVSFVLTTQAPRIRELYDDDFEYEEEDMMDM